MRYLPREDAPISGRTWHALDQAVVSSAKSQLAGRRVLEIEGPLGFGFRAMEMGEHTTEGEGRFEEARATMTAPRLAAIPLLQASFTLPIRDVAAAEEGRAVLDCGPAAKAAVAVARLEEQLVFHGSKALGAAGLMTASGSQRTKLGDWSKVGQPMEDLIKAVGTLDAAGFPGPYAAALAPGLYGELFRLYEESNVTQLQHVGQLLTAGVVKAPALTSGGVVVTAVKEFASILLAQDMIAAYVGPSGASYEFVVMESLVPRIVMPESICVLEAGK
jgi:uncharacterized linocin/CFP29 family protein